MHGKYSLHRLIWIPLSSRVIFMFFFAMLKPCTMTKFIWTFRSFFNVHFTSLYRETPQLKHLIDTNHRVYGRWTAHQRKVNPREVTKFDSDTRYQHGYGPYGEHTQQVGWVIRIIQFDVSVDVPLGRSVHRIHVIVLVGPHWASWCIWLHSIPPIIQTVNFSTENFANIIV